ncbi:hypothetical protein ABK905_01795 [Acerihabitans sp. KWT182]|uniref:Uncharacterized protein n=1 Tax=Acerihabitans sp. KWT182 TaxID=3157919 RepID=A0AAU7QAX3_9GAMM
MTFINVAFVRVGMMAEQFLNSGTREGKIKATLLQGIFRLYRQVFYVWQRDYQIRGKL